jgi:stage IV sporulation protein FB
MPLVFYATYRGFNFYVHEMHLDPWTAGLLGLSGFIIFYACVFAHEAGHALTAKKLGLSVQEISVGIFGGGTAVVAKWWEYPKQTLKLTLMGPTVTLILAGMC